MGSRTGKGTDGVLSQLCDGRFPLGDSVSLLGTVKSGSLPTPSVTHTVSAACNPLPCRSKAAVWLCLQGQGVGLPSVCRCAAASPAPAPGSLGFQF